MLQDFATIIEQIDAPVTEEKLESLEKIAYYLKELATDEMCIALLLFDLGDVERAREYEALADERISLLTSVRSYLELDIRDVGASSLN